MSLRRHGMSLRAIFPWPIINKSLLSQANVNLNPSDYHIKGRNIRATNFHFFRNICLAYKPEHDALCHYSNTLSPATSSASPTVSSTPTSTSLSNISSTVSVTSNPSSSASETQTSSPTSISSLVDPSTSPTSTPIITTSISGSDTSDSPTPTRTPTPTPTPTSSTTPVRESRSSDSASSTLTSVLITTVATVNGQPTTASCISLCLFILRTLQIKFQLTTVVPTLASSPPGPSGLSARSSKIVGGVVGGTLALLGVLLALFYISRRRRKAAAVRDAPRLQAPRQMLDADDFDLAEPGPAPYAYGMVGAYVNPNASGSIFHEVLPGTSTQPSHSYSRSVVSENDPLLVHHMRGGSADVDSVATSSPRESTHFRASSTTGLLYDPNDPFGDHPPRSVGPSSSRSHPLAVAKALEARSRGSDQHVYPPSAYRGPTEPSDPSSTSSPVLVHQDAGRVDPPDSSAPPARQAWLAQIHASKCSVTLKTVGRTFSLGTSLHESGSEGVGREIPPKRSPNPLLHVQTHTGVRNMAHGLHILRQIEEKFGAIESYLFPRESGTNEYHPSFFFRFRDPKSIRRLTKPFTHFDVPILTLEDKPNHEIGINDVGYLISPDSRNFFLARGLELMKKEAGDSVDATPEEATTPSNLSKPSTLKSRYAVRVAASGLDEYPQPFFSHKTINPREKPRIQRELAAWKSAYEAFGSGMVPLSKPEIRPKTQTIDELLQENFNIPQNTLVLPQRKHTQEPKREENDEPEQAEQPPQPTEYQLFKVHSRKAIRPASGEPPSGSRINAEVIAENNPLTKGVAVDNTPAVTSPMKHSPQLNTKRERQLEQMRRAAASQVRSIAEKRRIEEEAAKQPKPESEADHQISSVKQEPSLWDRFLKR
ncbi:hypothetical protein FRC11_013405 [Ceratobasidium sp. 423]|nr:hypothetical protein FRC11_013405 [Ceratobasidium sp. 423]